MHHAAKAVIVVDRVVLGAAIVPQRDRSYLPAETAREFRARRVGKKIAQQRRALFNRHVPEAQRVPAIGVKCIGRASSWRISSEISTYVRLRDVCLLRERKLATLQRRRC